LGKNLGKEAWHRGLGKNLGKEAWVRISGKRLGHNLGNEAYTDLSLSYSFLDMSLISRYRYIWCFIAYIRWLRATTFYELCPVCTSGCRVSGISGLPGLRKALLTITSAQTPWHKA
jgi:hypothetical protein